ncbi:MAG: class II poly(R)-hydroxyalkanoic acid synthase, partial [Pseudomonas sp.]
MQEKPAKGNSPAPVTVMNAQNAITGLRGRDLISTLRQVGRQGLRDPLHTARHLLALGSQLGRVMLGDSPLQPHPRDTRFADPTWQDNPLYRRGLQAYLAWQKQSRLWIEHSSLSADDRARAQFLLNQINDALAPSNSLLNPLAVKELLNTGGQSLLRGLGHLLDDLRHNDGMPRQVDQSAFAVGGNVAN